MNVVGRVGSLISQGVYSVATPFHPFGGAVDVIVVQQQDGTFRSTPWYVRFGKFQGVLKGAEKVVQISVNGVEANFHMYLDNSGEAYFIKEVDAGKGSEINGVVKDSDNLEVGDNNKDSTIDDIHRIQHSVSDSGVLRFQDEYVPLRADRIERAESDADRRFYDFQDEQSSLEGSVELSEYGSNRYESLNGEDFVEPQSTESEVVLVSVDGLVLTAPISASEQDTENVQLSIPQFHLGPGERTNFCEGNEEFSTGENVWAADHISNLSALPANVATNDVGSISSNDHAAGHRLEVCEGEGDHVCLAQEALDITNQEGKIPMESESEEVSANVTREEVFKCPLELSELTKQVNNDNLEDVVSSLDVKNSQEISQQSPPAINEDKDGGAVEPRNDDGLSASCSFSSPGNETSPCVQVGVESLEKNAWDAEHTGSDSKSGHSVSHGLKSEVSSLDVKNLQEISQQTPPAINEDKDGGAVEPRNDDGLSSFCSSSSPGNETSPVVQVGVESSEKIAWDAEHTGSDSKSGHSVSRGLKSEVSSLDVKNLQEISQQTPPAINEDKDGGAVEPRNDDGLSASCSSSSPGNETSPVVQVGVESSEKIAWDAEHTGSDSKSGHSVSRGLKSEVFSLDVKKLQEISQQTPPAINEDKDGGAVEPRNDDGLSASCSSSSPGNKTSPVVQVGVESSEKIAWDAEHTGSDSKLGHSVSRGLKSEVFSLDVKNLQEISQQTPPAINEDKDGGAVEPGNDDGLSASCSSSSPGNKTSPVVQVGVESSEKIAWDAEHTGSDRQSGHSVSRGLKSEVFSLDVKNLQEISQQTPPAINEDKDGGAVEPGNDDGLSASCSSSSPGNKTSPVVQVGVESSEKIAWDAEHTGSDRKMGHSVPHGLKSEDEKFTISATFEGIDNSPQIFAEEDQCNEAEPAEPHTAVSSEEIQAQSIIKFEISLCRNELHPGMGLEAAAEAFDARRVSAEEFKNSAASIMRNENLIIRFRERYLLWEKAAPLVLGMAAFGLDLAVEPKDAIPVEQIGTPQPRDDDPGSASSSGRRWRLWPPFRRVKSLEHSSSSSSNEDVFVDSESGNSQGISTMASYDGNESPHKQFIRTNVPTNEQIASLNLKEGQNMITFSFSTRVLGRQQVEAHIYLWRWNAKIVISDVDGTITRSDVLGQFMPLVGRDWSQSGVARLFSAIEENGYQLLFLSARAIVQAYLTRNFLFNLKQDGKTLPKGPVVISPDGLFPSLYREVIRRAPHEFKIGCLEDIRKLFPSEYNPFYAGFGNRDTDELSYRKMGIPKGKIFIINPKGEVATSHRVDVKSYTSLHTLVNDMFPPTSLVEQEDFNAWNFWKMPLPDIDLS